MATKKTIEYNFKVTNPVAYSKLLSLFKDKQTIQISVGGQNLREEITKIKEKLGEKPIKVPIELTTTATGIKALKTQIQEGLGPIAVDLTLSRGAITNLQKQIEEGLNVTLKGTGVPNPAGSSGGRKGKLSDSTLRALINEEARDVAGGKRTATRRGLVTRSARGKATVEVLQNLVGNSSSAVANRAAQSRLEEAPSRAILAAGGSVVKSIRSGASPIGANRLRSAALAQAQALEATSPVLATKLYGLVDSLDAAQRVAESRTLAPVRKVRGSNRKSSATSLVREFASDVANQRNTSVATGGVRQASIQRSVTGLQSVSQGTSTTAVSARKTLSQLNAAPVKALLKDAGALVAGIKNGAVDPAYINTKAQLESTRNSLIAAGADPELIKKVSGALNAIDVADQKIIDKLAPKTPKVPKAPKGPIAKSDLQNRVANATRSISKGKFLPSDLPALEKDIEAKLSSATDPAEVARLTGLRDKVNFAKEDFGKFVGGLRDKELTAREKADLKAKAQKDFINKTTARFNRGQLGSVAFKGAEEAAKSFEEAEGLPTGSVDRSRIGQAVGPQKKFSAGINKFLGKASGGRLSFDLKRNIDDPEAANELAFASLFGGPVGAIGGAIGGGLFGRPGIFAGSAIAQVGVGSIAGIFENLTKTLTDAAKAGLAFQQSVSGISIAFQATSKVRGADGKILSPEDTVKFQNARSRNLIRQAAPELASVGLGGESGNAALRGSIAGLARAGFQVNDNQIVQVAKTIGGFSKFTNADLVANPSRFANDIEDLLAGGGNNELTRSLFGSVAGQGIKNAAKTGDTEALFRELGKFSTIIDKLASSSDNASTALGKIDARVQILGQSFGDAFLKAIIPALDELQKALGDPALVTALQDLGRGVGRLVNDLVKGGAKLANSLPDGVLGGAAQTVASAITGNRDGVATGLIKTATGFATSGIKDQNARRSINDLAGKVADLLFNGAQSGGESTSKGTVENIVPRRSIIEQKIPRLSASDNETEQFLAGVAKTKLLGTLKDNTGDGTFSDLETQIRIQKDVASFANKKLLQRTDTNTFQGQLEAGELGIQQRVRDGSISGQVGASQSQVNFFETVAQAGDAFFKLQDAVNSTTRSMEDLAAKSKDLSNQTSLLLAAQKTLEDNERLKTLTGAERRQELAKRVVAAGGINPMSGNNMGEFFIDEPDSLFAKNRKLEIAEKEFAIENSRVQSVQANPLLPGFDLRTPEQIEREQRANALTGQIRDNKRAVSDLGFEQGRRELQNASEIFSLGSKFGGNEDPSKLDALGIPGLRQKFEESKNKLSKTATDLNLPKGVEELQKSLQGPLDTIAESLNTLINSLEQKIQNGVTNAFGANP